MSDTTEALETELAQHIEGVMYADDIPEGTGYLPGTDTPIPDDYERRYCEVDGEDWPCLTRRAAAALAAARTENERLNREFMRTDRTKQGYRLRAETAEQALVEANRKIEATQIEWAVEISWGDNRRYIQYESEEACERFMKNPPLWYTAPEGESDMRAVCRIAATPWGRILSTDPKPTEGNNV